jgi:hypothetical protein
MIIFAHAKQNLLDAIEAEQVQTVIEESRREFDQLHSLYWEIYHEVTFAGIENTLAKFLLKFKGETSLGDHLP